MVRGRAGGPFRVVAERSSYLEIKLVPLGKVQVRGSGNMFEETEARERSSCWGLESTYEKQEHAVCWACLDKHLLQVKWDARLHPTSQAMIDYI